MAPRRDFSGITVVTVTGQVGPDGGDLATHSLVHSAAQLPGARALMLSPQRPTNLPAYVEHRRVKPFGSLEYSVFIMYALAAFIETDHLLVVQHDGWVLNADNWDDRFLAYDYIGAPSVTALVTDPAGGQSVGRDFSWQTLVGVPGYQVRPVYNGGFSLRSRRLMRAPIELGLQMNLFLPQLTYRGAGALTTYELSWTYGHHAEDAQLCIFMRPQLEAAGMRFAPLDLAKAFSFEFLGETLHAGYDLGASFGAHCRLRSLVSHDPPIVRYHAPEAVLRENHRQLEVREFLARYPGYRVVGQA